MPSAVDTRGGAHYRTNDLEGRGCMFARLYLGPPDDSVLIRAWLGRQPRRQGGAHSAPCAGEIKERLSTVSFPPRVGW